MIPAHPCQAATALPRLTASLGQRRAPRPLTASRQQAPQVPANRLRPTRLQAKQLRAKQLQAKRLQAKRLQAKPFQATQVNHPRRR